MSIAISQPTQSFNILVREIKNLPKVLNSVVSELSTRTGWSFLILAGGPEPSNGGKIRTVSMYEGRRSLGHTFAKSHPTFEDDYVKPFTNFLKQAYRELQSFTAVVHVF